MTTYHQYQSDKLYKHNTDPRTDHLYDPLRHVVQNPNQTLRRSRQLPEAVKHSDLTHQYRPLNADQMHRVREETLIPVNRSLHPTHDRQELLRLHDSRFVAVDVEERVDRPLTEQQMHMRRRKGFTKEETVYKLGDQVKTETRVYSSPPPPPPPTSTLPTKSSYPMNPKDNDYKYNFFSMIDQPVEKCKKFGCTGCSFPPNQCIAQDSKHNSNWLK